MLTTHKVSNSVRFYANVFFFVPSLNNCCQRWYDQTNLTRMFFSILWVFHAKVVNNFVSFLLFHFLINAHQYLNWDHAKRWVIKTRQWRQRWCIKNHCIMSIYCTSICPLDKKKTKMFFMMLCAFFCCCCFCFEILPKTQQIVWQTNFRRISISARTYVNV